VVIDQSRLEDLLRTHWGHERFRPGQDEAVAAVLAGRDALFVMPTGGGKSLCYQLPALVLDRLTLVVSPLIALMQDQVESLRKRGIPAACLHSQLSGAEIEQVLTDAEFGRYRLLYIAPERLDNELFQARAGRLRTALLAVDEAHCISEWGYDFRPAYLDIPRAYPLLGHPPVIALTATATPAVRRDIAARLALREPFTLVRGFDRPNLVWSVFETTDKMGKLRDVLAGVDGSGVVYVATRRAVTDWLRRLRRLGVATSGYHGGMEARDREREAADWLAGRTRVMVATNAFGMGIDHPHVRFVVHADAPATLEGYYQEAGRAGRDGARAYAVLLYDPADERIHRGLIADSHPDRAFLAAVYDAVCQANRIAIGSWPDAPVALPESALPGVSQARVRSAVELLEREGVWTIVRPRRQVASVRFLVPPRHIREQAGVGPDLAPLLDALIRSVPADAFVQWEELDLRQLERKAGLAGVDLARHLDVLQERQLLRWIPPADSLRLAFAGPRPERFRIDDRAIRHAGERALARLKEVERYARATGCRRRYLLAYFGEDAPDRCSRCDACLGRHEPVVIEPDDEALLVQLLGKIRDGELAAVFAGLSPAHRRKHEAALQRLEEEGLAECVDPLLYRYTLTRQGARYLDRTA
jgi:ATP-dependent DNA helicase RecQ